MTTAGRRLAIPVSLSLVLVVAVGLFAGIWNTPASLFANAGGPLSARSVALPAVLLAGLADGINPCAFTVLLLFVASIASMYRGTDAASTAAVRSKLLLYGGAFIFAIFLTYLTLGTGLLKGSALLTQNHVGARLGALVAVFLGLWMLKDFFVPAWGPRLTAPAAVGNLVRTWGQRASFATMFGLGVLIGLCTVPCSGAVYMAVLSLLALQQSFALSYTYLVLYNLMFIAPLVAILAAASARPAMNRLARWNLHHREWVRLALGSGVVIMGLAILATA